MRVNGPYVHGTGRLKGRSYVNIYYDDGKKTSKLYSRYLMEQKLGRKLDRGETVDHIDEDFTNDNIENLQILTLSENAKKHARIKRPIEYVEFTCPVCGNEAKKEARNVKHNLKRGKDGPFCGRSCAGKWSHFPVV